MPDVPPPAAIARDTLAAVCIGMWRISKYYSRYRRAWPWRSNRVGWALIRFSSSVFV